MTLVGFNALNHPQQIARRGARPEVDDRATAPEVFAPLHERFRFSIDAAALPHNAKCERYFGPPHLSPVTWRCMWQHPKECGVDGCAGCEHRRTPPLALDGLAQPWSGERVWCNPPYSSIEPWVEKACAEWERREPPELIVMLLPANRTEQGWWQRHIEPTRRSGYLDVEFLSGRLRFIAHNATEVKPNQRPPFGCCLVIWECSL